MTTNLYEGYISSELLNKEWELLQLKIDEELRSFIWFCLINGVKTLESCQGGWHIIRLYGRIDYKYDAAVIFDTAPDPHIQHLVEMAKLDPETFDVYEVRYYEAFHIGVKVCWPSSQTKVVIPQLMKWLQT